MKFNDDEWVESIMRMCDEAKEMVRKIDKKIDKEMDENDGEFDTIVYRLKGNNWRTRLKLAWRILTKNETTIKISTRKKK